MGKKSRTKRKHIPKKEYRQILNWLIPLGLVGLVIGTFLLRTIPSWNEVFVDGQVWFRGVDPWYHMRLVDNMMANFPTPLKLDMLILFPDGMNVGYFPLMSWMIALPGQLFNYEVVGALLPPIFGALILVPIFFICKTLWKDWVGLIACMLVMILPTELFHRSLLGFTDHHVLEAFFMSCTILFLILMHKDKKLKWTILGGVSLGLYLACWSGGLLLVVPILIWFLIALLYKLKKEEPVKDLVGNLTIVFGLGLLIYFPNMFFIQGIGSYVVIMGIVTVSPMVLFRLSKILNWKVIIGIVSGAIILFVLISFVKFPTIVGVVRSVIGYSSTSTIQEAMPSYPKLIMAQLGISFLLFLGGLTLAIKRRQNLLLIIWCILLLILVLGQRRWSYYFTLADAILSGYFIYLIAGWMHRQVRVAVVSVICIVLLATTMSGTIGISNVKNYMTADWYNTCVWLRENTPEVSGYYELEGSQPPYGILHWWDYGNWTTRVGHRTPISNPMAQTPSIQWQIFLAKSEEDAENYLEGIKYIIVSEAEVTGKFYAIVHLSHYDEVTWKPFIFILWEEKELVGWTKIHQEGGIKVYGRI